MVRPALPLLALAFLMAAAIPVLANHPQTVYGTTATFDHIKGNEWWVEVKVTASAPIDAVEARLADQCSDGFTTMSGCGAHHLTLNQWGIWAGSFHIPPGERVEFLAYQNGGMSSVWEIASCPFTHPAGVEQCGSSSTTTSTVVTDPCPPVCGDEFNAPFTGFRGNEWWVQAKVGTNGPSISKVDVHIAPAGAWMPLAKQDWNTAPASWAGSYHFPQGSILQMRATASDGRTDLSSCRQWVPPANTDATIVPCPGTSSSSSSTTTSQPPPFDATFTNVKGNEYWAEAVIKANGPIHAVLMKNCSTNEEEYDMAYHPEWGKWTLGRHIPSGSKVYMTAIGEGGSDRSGAYLWPSASPTTGC